jgi:DNA-directed RNA polymerase subunit beta'
MAIWSSMTSRAMSVPSQRVAYGSKIYVDEGDAVKRGQRLAEWDPYTRPMMTEVDGVVEFEDVVDGVSVSEATDEVDRHHQASSSTGVHPRGADLKPAIVIKDKKGEIAQAGRVAAMPAYQLSVDAILSVEPGAKVSQGDVLARIPLESAKTKDITGGLPRVAELFEARRPKDHAIIAEIDGTWSALAATTRTSAGSRSIVRKRAMEPVEYLIPKGKHFHLQEGDYIERATTSSTATRHRTTFWRSRAWRLGGLPRQRDPGSLPPAGRVASTTSTSR